MNSAWTITFVQFIEVKFYHYLTFDEDGMLINGGDYGDATGVVMAVAPDPES